MAQKKVKRRIHKGRVTGVFIIFLIMIIIISNIAKGSEEQPDIPSSASHDDSSSPIITNAPSEKGILTVVIDAGHGGTDPGSLSRYNGRQEKDDNLNIALEVQKQLQQSDVEINIIMTRSDDTFISLDERCNIANNANADLFVSLHRNSADNASGVEVWVHNDEPAPDCRLAYNIITGLENAGISKNKGIRFGYITDKTLNYQVNRETNMPSCLVELGFMSSVEDNSLLDNHIEDYGKAIAEAIIKTARELGIKGLKYTDKVKPIETQYYNYEVTDYIPADDVGAH